MIPDLNLNLKGKNMKILRICLQGGEEQIFDSKEDLRQSLIDLHEDDVLQDEECTPAMLKRHQESTLDELCFMYDWSYREITDKEARGLNNG